MGYIGQDGGYYEGEMRPGDRPANASEQAEIATRAVKGLLVAAIQDHLDAAARSLGYDDIKSAATYADESSVARFQAEGRALRSWRSLVWAHAYSVMAAVDAGQRSVPTAGGLIAELPALVLPSS